MILNKEQIKQLIREKELVKGYIDLSIQLQPNGFDLTLDKIFTFTQYGVVQFSDKVLPNVREVKHTEEYGMFNLSEGTYLFSVNETIKLPENIFGISTQRSTLMRSGVLCNVGFWDCGYNGKGFSVLNVLNPYGFRIQQNSRLIQIVFHETYPTELYNGQYQKEGIKIDRETQK